MSFVANKLGHDLNHSIVFKNKLIVCTHTHVYLGMKTSVDKESFHFLCTKNLFFIYLNAKTVFFTEASLVKKRPLIPVCKVHRSRLEQLGLTKRD
jgi:hypothetical protein